MEDGGTCRYINVESATAYWRGAGCPNQKVDCIPVIICHITVQRNVKTIKDISKQEKI